MRILFLTNSMQWGGAEKYVLAVADALALRGHRCWIAAPRGSATHSAAATRPGLSAIEFDLGPKLARRTAPDLALRWRVYKARMQQFLVHALKSFAIDVVHFQFKKEQLVGTPIAASLGLPVVWTEHGLLPRGLVVIPPARVAYVRAAARTAAILCVSDAVRRDMQRRGVAADLLRLCHNGIEMPTVSDAAAAGIRAELGMNATQPLIGNVARLARVKGIDVLVDAAKVVLESVPDARFVVAGDGPERKALEARSRRAGIAHGVRFLGHRHDVPAIIRACDVFVAPSRAEGLAFAVLEAMALSRAIVAANVGGLPEALDDGRAGRLVERANAGALARDILELLWDPGQRSALGGAAYRRYCSLFRFERMIDETEAVFHAALPTRRTLRTAAHAASLVP